MGEQFDATRPIYAQIAERMTGRILSGEYPPGAHLESVRELAAAAGVNPNTMQRALAYMESEGLLRTERTSGRYITDDAALLERLRRRSAHKIAREYLDKMRDIGYGPDKAAEFVAQWSQEEEEI